MRIVEWNPKQKIGNRPRIKLFLIINKWNRRQHAGAADIADDRKNKKYEDLLDTHHLIPLVLEALGPMINKRSFTFIATLTATWHKRLTKRESSFKDFQSLLLNASTQWPSPFRNNNNNKNNKNNNSNNSNNSSSSSNNNNNRRSLLCSATSYIVVFPRTFPCLSYWRIYSFRPQQWSASLYSKSCLHPFINEKSQLPSLPDPHSLSCYDFRKWFGL